MKDLTITKASGEIATFSEAKLRKSLLRSGASEEQVDNVIHEITGRLFNGISTKRIYDLAFELLKSNHGTQAARYHLKHAIMELGPSGFPFEKYVGEILRRQGYNIRIGEIVQGHCVQHEIDVIAKLNHNQFMIECKYHNLQGTICDVKIPLYVQSRFKDVEAAWLDIPGNEKVLFQGWVVTNTRFSSDAMKYASCAGLRLVGWDYPASGSLKDQIDELGLYPITCLTTLTKTEKQYLLDRKIVLCQELNQNTKLLEHAGIKPPRIDLVLKETYLLCKHLTGNTTNAKNENFNHD